MLNLIRNNVQSFGVKLIVLVVAGVMLFFGVDAFQNQGVNVLATVNGKDIRLEDYQRALQTMEAQYYNVFKGKAREVMEQDNVRAKLLSGMVQEELMAQVANANGIEVTDLEVAEFIWTIELFQTEGRFDKQLYQQFLDQNRISAKNFERQIKADLLKRKLSGLVVEGQSVSQAQIKMVYDRDFATYDLVYLKLNPKVFSETVTPKDQDLQKFYDEHKHEFTLPQQYALRYVVIEGANQADKVVVSDKEIEKYFERNRKELSTPVSFRSRHILIAVPQDGNEAGMKKAEDLAQSLAKELQKNPARFAELAKKHSADAGSASKGGDLGFQPLGSLVPSYEEALGRLQINQVSEPVMSNYGFHIIQLLGKKEAEPAQFEALKEKIRAELTQKKLERRLQNQADKVLEIAQKEGFAKATQGLEIKETPSFGPLDQLPGIGLSFMLHQQLKALKQGGVGSYLLPQGQRMIFEVANVTEERTQPFEEVKGELYPRVKADLELEASLKKTLDAASEVKDLGAMNNLAKKMNASVSKTSFEFGAREIPGLKVDTLFLNQLRNMQEKQFRPVLNRSEAYLVFLEKKTLPTLDEAKLEAQTQQMKNAKSKMLLDHMLQSYQAEAKVEYNQSLLAQLDIQL